jgi:sterol desaturase/sphingolipid hydroxylase (fatty acid hydroxylase superfamily)
MAPANFIFLALPVFLSLILMELAFDRLARLSRYCWRDTLVSILLGLGSMSITLLSSGFVFGISSSMARYALFDIGYVWWAGPVCFLVVDLAYYASHRTAHAVRWFWASHVVHHSSEHYNLSTAVRQGWTGPLSVDLPLRLALFLIGFPQPVLLVCIGLNLLYQFWIHTEVVGRLPRWVEAILNTPAHHRIHHATNTRYLDRNFAGVFIVWDRMFGTFAVESPDEAPRYGLVAPLRSFNPVRAAFHEWQSIGRDMMAAPGFSNKLGYLWHAPGWRHEDTPQTARPCASSQVAEAEA